MVGLFQAFFGVFDGHGGRAAVDFVSNKLGKNIITAVAELDKEENQLELAIRTGYLTTDKEFLKQVWLPTCQTPSKSLKFSFFFFPPLKLRA